MGGRSQEREEPRCETSERGGYGDGMAKAEERDPRANQKDRTRQAIIDAALEFIEEGVMPSVVEAAERAKVSRATAYRYFPTQPDLAGTLVALNPTMKEVKAALEESDSKDPAERLTVLL